MNDTQYPWNDFHFEVDIKQDIETYIDWDVDTDINVDIDKYVDVDIDVDIDVKDQGSLVTAVVKDFDFDYEADQITVIADTTAIEDVLSTGELTVVTDNVQAQLTASAYDRSATPFANDYYKIFDSATFTEINLGIDNVAGDFTIITLDMQALVDG